MTADTRPVAQDERSERLRRECPRGNTVWSIERHVTRSGRTRRIDLYSLGNGSPRWLSGQVAKALGLTYHEPDNTIALTGRMEPRDVVQALAEHLYGDPGALFWGSL